MMESRRVIKTNSIKREHDPLEHGKSNYKIARIGWETINGVGDNVYAGLSRSVRFERKSALTNFRLDDAISSMQNRINSGLVRKYWESNGNIELSGEVSASRWIRVKIRNRRFIPPLIIPFYLSILPFFPLFFAVFANGMKNEKRERLDWKKRIISRNKDRRKIKMERDRIVMNRNEMISRSSSFSSLENLNVLILISPVDLR